jgi:hypothetical protein
MNNIRKQSCIFAELAKHFEFVMLKNKPPMSNVRNSNDKDATPVDCRMLYKNERDLC